MTRRRTDQSDRRGGDPLTEDAATRHLCVGVYLDRAFRWTVLHRVHNDPSRVIPPSYGFYLIPVVSHAWRAWIIETVQRTAVLAVLVALFAVHRAAFIAVIRPLSCNFPVARQD